MCAGLIPQADYLTERRSASDDPSDLLPAAGGIGYDQEVNPLSPQQAGCIHVSCQPTGATVDCGEVFTVPTTITNGTTCALDACASNPMFIGYHWLNRSGTPVRLDAGRMPINPPLPPGGAATYPVNVAAPSDSGDFTLRITLVQEWIQWFDQPGTNVFVDIPVTVQKNPWWTAETRNSIPYAHLDILNNRTLKQHLSYQGKCRPLLLHVETTNICNLECIICPYGKMTRKRESLPIQVFRKVIRDYCAMGGGDVVLTPQVGDVLLDKSLVERIRLMKQERGIRSIGFVTNGANASVFSNEELDAVVNACQRIKISLYGLTEDEYFLMTRRRGMYSRVVDCIRRIISVNRHCRVVLAGRFLRKHSSDAVRSWMRSSFGCELSWGAITEFGNWGGALDTSRPLPLDAEWLSPGCAAELEAAGPCAYPIYHLKVLVNGDVNFCSCVDYDNDPENSIGSVHDQVLSDIYNGERAKALWRNGLRACRGCTHRRPLGELPLLIRGFHSPLIELGV